MSIILHIETTTEDCSVALSKDGELLSELCNFETKSHASMLMPLIDKILSQQSIDRKLLDAVALSGGPGSYTGLRIGCSTAKGICYALGIPLISTSTLRSAAFGVRKYIEICNDDLLFPAIDARRMEVYAMLLSPDFKIIRNVDAFVIDENYFDEFLADGKRIIISGNAAKKLEILFGSKSNIVVVEDKVHLASNGVEEAYQKFVNNDFEDVAYYEPFYLKSFVPGKPRVKGLD